MDDPRDVVEASQFALLMGVEAERGAFEKKLNSVQVDLDGTFLAQSILPYSDSEFIVVCRNTSSSE